MATHKELKRLEILLYNEITRRQSLGEYNPDAKALLLLAEVLLDVLRHINPNPAK